MFKANDIIQSIINPHNPYKCLVIGTYKDFYCLKVLTGTDKGDVLKYRKDFVDKNFKFIAYYTPKQPKEVFKPNSEVEIIYSTNPDYIGKTAIFVVTLSKEIKVDNILCDCLVKLDGKYRFYRVDCLKRIPKANRPQKGNFTKEELYAPLFKIEMSDKKVIAKRIKEFDIDEDNKRIVIKEQETFEARCHRKDQYDEQTGVLLALARAYNDDLLEEFILNRNLFKKAYNLVKYANEVINDK